MFVGSHQLTIDEKGRVAIPTRYRPELSEICNSQLVITRGPNPCLEIYPANEFRRLADEIQAMDDRQTAEVLKEVLISSAYETDIDRQGRVLLPPMLRRRVNFEGAVVLMGKITRFDLWRQDLWEERFGDQDGEYAQSVERAFQALKR